MNILCRYFQHSHSTITSQQYLSSEAKRVDDTCYMLAVDSVETPNAFGNLYFMMCQYEFTKIARNKKDAGTTRQIRDHTIQSILLLN